MIKKNKNQILKNYISPIDIALAQFDQSHSPTPAQEAEIKKYQKIYWARDHKVKVVPKKQVSWDF